MAADDRMDAAKTKDGITTTIISNNNSSSASNGAYVRQMLNGANEKKSEGSGSAKQSRMVAIGQVTKGANFIDHIFGCNVGQHPTSNIVSVALSTPAGDVCELDFVHLAGDDGNDDNNDGDLSFQKKKMNWKKTKSYTTQKISVVQVTTIEKHKLWNTAG